MTYFSYIILFVPDKSVLFGKLIIIVEDMEVKLVQDGLFLLLKMLFSKF